MPTLLRRFLTTLKPLFGRLHYQPPYAAYRSYFVSNTVQWLTLVYVGLIVYISLHPLLALRFDGHTPWAFLSHKWAGVDFHSFDNFSNIAAYIPLGFGLVWLRLGYQLQALSRATTLRFSSGPGFTMAVRLAKLRAIALATLLSGAVSLSIEVLQSYSPARVASTLDIACNTLGALMGAGLGVWLKGRRSGLMMFVTSCFSPQSGAVFAVLGLWSLAQLNPQGWAFMTAPLAQLMYTWLPVQQQGLDIELNAKQLYNLELSACIVAVGNVLSLVRLRLHQSLKVLPRVLYMLFTLGMVLLWQVLAYTVQFGFDGWVLLFNAAVMDALIWLLLAAAALAILPSPTALVLAVLLLAVHIALAQMLPAHPYVNNSELWQQARLKHLHGLTNLISGLWPILALLALMWQSRYKRYKA
jgi:VanZ family protein